jgi:hypothetical protein|tara:strand:- start:149 stop:436 length:288 start_codon:yes stop_codon:yes gene_type:complete
MGENMLKKIACIISFVILFGCIGPADYKDQPNRINRVEVISKNKNGVTIEHSTWGKKIAFRLADEHCAKQDKVATYMGASQQYGPDVISTWMCEK